MDAKIIHGDCIKEMRKLPENSVDLIITDPPYNIGVNYGKNKDNKTRDEYFKWSVKWIRDCERILKKNGSIYIINYPENNAYIMNALRNKTKLLFRNWLTWHYASNIGHSKKNFTRSQRSILFYSKGNKFKFRLDEGEVLSDMLYFDLVKNVSKEKVKGFPNQIPLALVDLIIETASNPGDLVFDPFSGTGTTLVSAINNGRKALGIELEEKNIEIIKKRLEEAGESK